MKTLVIAGSNSVESINQLYAQKLSLANGYEYFDLRMLDLPMFNRDLSDSDNYPYDVLGFKEMLEGYNNLVIVTPEYNGNPPAYLKSLLDWISRMNMHYLDGINVVVVSVTTGKAGGASVRQNLSTMLGFANANVLGNVGVGKYEEGMDFEESFAEVAKLINSVTK